MNMAIDELLWHSATAPRLRFYEWDYPALSFGYFGHYSEVARFAPERELVRRCTGGGVVFHGSDLTYALVIPGNVRGQETSSMTIYQRVHEAVQRAMRDVGIAATLVPRVDGRRSALRNAASGNEVAPGRGAQRATATDATLTPACFANPVAFDVMLDEKKIAGAAQRRSRRGLLQQGSIQNIELSAEFRDRFIVHLCRNPVILTIDPALLREAESLAKSKYGSNAWLRRV